MKILWTDRKTNEEVLQLAGVQRSLMKTIRQRHEISRSYKQKEWNRKNFYYVGKLKGKEVDAGRKLYKKIYSRTTSYKYLGLHLDQTLNFEDYFIKIYKQAGSY